MILELGPPVDGGGGRGRGHAHDPSSARTGRAPPTCSPTRSAGRLAPCCWPGDAGPRGTGGVVCDPAALLHPRLPGHVGGGAAGGCPLHGRRHRSSAVGAAGGRLVRGRDGCRPAVREPSSGAARASELVREASLWLAILLLGDMVPSRRGLAREHRLLQVERARSERLLRSILPEPIAERLKQRQGLIADASPQVTVLFADIADFTPHTEHSPPEAAVALLNELFSQFDALTETRGLQKIKTIGDAYMVAGGLADPCSPAGAVAELAWTCWSWRPAAASQMVGRSSCASGSTPGRSWRASSAAQVELRPVGRHGEHRQPHGDHEGPRMHPGHTADPSRLLGERYVVRQRGQDPGQGQGEDAHLLVAGELAPIHARPDSPTRELARSRTAST